MLLDDFGSIHVGAKHIRLVKSQEQRVEACNVDQMGHQGDTYGKSQPFQMIPYGFGGAGKV